MSNYTKATDFAAKDDLPTGNAAKIVKGTEIDDEFVALQSAIATKLDITTFNTDLADLKDGNVLQVVYGNAASTVNTSNSSSYIDSATASITPSATSSKIFIIANPYLSIDRPSANQAQVSFYIDKDGTLIYSAQNFKIQDTDTNAGFIVQPVIHYLDSPATTSSVTYTVKARNVNTTGSFTSFDISSITLMEIGA